MSRDRRRPRNRLETNWSWVKKIVISSKFDDETPKMC